MAKIRNVLRYLRQYGLKSTLGLIREKLIVDPKRFSPEKKRKLPDFPAEYKRAATPSYTGENEKLTVLYCLHYFYPKKKGGTERFTLNIAKEAAARGNRPIVLVLEANEPTSLYPQREGDILYRYYEYDGVRCIGFRYQKAPLGLYYKNITENDAAQRRFAEFIIAKEEVGLVHATYPQPFAPLLAVCRERGLPYLVTCTDFCAICHYSTMVDDNGDFCGGSDKGARCSKVCPTYGCKDHGARLLSAKRMLEGASLVTVPSEFVARVLSREFPTVPFLPVNHGISDAFTKKEGRDKVRRFVYAGTISRLKGIHLLIEAFKRLEGEELSLLIYGSGDAKYEAALKKMADERVKFMGAAPADEMPRIYGEADCVIVPSMWYETYNFVVREAAETGALVIAADIGAMPEAIIPGRNGFVFKPGDGESLYEKMCEALDFDFTVYRSKTYPRLSDEGDLYDAAYRAAVFGANK